MKKKLLSLWICLLTFLRLIVPVSAAETPPMVVDRANLLTASEEAALEAKVQNIRDTYSMDAVILTLESLDGWSAQDYADNYYDQNGYGSGENHSGILFLLAMREREWYLSTYGDAIYAVTDYGVQQLGEMAAWYFSAGDYYAGFDAYLDALPDYLYAYQEGAPIDGYADSSGDYYHGDQEAVVYYEENSSPNLLLSLGLGILVAGIVVAVMGGSMNTKRQQHGAASYLKAGSFRLRSHQDLFLYSNVSKVRRQQNSNNGGGGSSVHRSSSGRSHGGGGGKF